MDKGKMALHERTGLKALAAVLASVCLFMCIATAILTVICVHNNVYFGDNNDTFLKNVKSRILQSDLNSQFHYLWNQLYNATSAQIITYEDGKVVCDAEELDKYLSDFFSSEEDGNYIFNIYDEHSSLIYSTLSGYTGGSIDGYTDSMGDYSTVVTLRSSEEEPYTDVIYIPENEFYSYHEIISYLENSADGNSLTGTFYGTFIAGDNTVSYVPLATCESDGSSSSFSSNDSLVYTFYANLEDFWSDDRNCYPPIADDTAGETPLPELQPNATTTVTEPVRQPDEVYYETELYPQGTEPEEYAVYPSIKFVGSRRPTYDEVLTIRALISDNAQFSIFNAASAIVEVIVSFSRWYPILCGLSAVLLLAVLIWLLCACGWHSGKDAPEVIWFDKIPVELFIAAGAVGLGGIIEVYYYLSYNIWNHIEYGIRLLSLTLSVLIILCVCVYCVLTLMTLATRLKTGTFWKYSIIGLVLKVIYAAAKVLWHIAASVRLTWKVLAVMALTAFAVAIFGSIGDNAVFLALFCLALLTCGMLIWAEGFTRIRDYTKKIAKGELDAKIDRNFLFGDLRKIADDLEGVGGGVKKAVDERMRSERLKTELITNVSHDLKTPLTSIVNYVDILSKDDIESPEAREHIEVLKRHAARMKKLIEDLVEVSKAASGNVSVNLERTDVNLLLTQTAAEYASKLEECRLEPVVKIPEKKMTASLDGRLMWRVLDNLMSNICKYALANTRVYITAEDAGSFVRVTFKNISRFRLDTDGEELMERFVRGDQSRNTEGSGLGLSIAKSLCDLQGVGFGISADGDLFKAELVITKDGDGSLLEDEQQQDVIYDSEEGDAEECRENPESD